MLLPRTLTALAAALALLMIAGVTALPIFESSRPTAPARAAAGYAPGTGFDYGGVASSPAAVKNLGFRWIKVFLSWRDIQPQRGVFRWYDPPIDEARAQGIKVLALVFDPPDWALSTPNRHAPPANDVYLAEFISAVAAHYRGRIAAYELWNEQNQAANWGNQRPSPARYTQMLRAAYPALKVADPNALLVTGGLATAGDENSPSALGDLLYIKHLYRPSQPADPAGPCSDPAAQADLANGARGYFDALGIHPYGGPWAPNTEPASVQWTSPGVYFRRAEQARQMMEIWGCDDRPLFATEFGYLASPADNGVTSCALDPYFNPFVLSQEQRALWLAQAFQYAREHWPWMGPIFVMNVDFAVGFNPAGECTLAGWSLLRSDGSPTPAYLALQQLSKAPPADATPQLSPASAVVLGAPNTVPRTQVVVTNAALIPSTWSAGAAAISPAGSWLQAQVQSNVIAISATSPRPAGTYSGVVTINFPQLASLGLQSTVQVPVKFILTSQIFRLYLPSGVR